MKDQPGISNANRPDFQKFFEWFMLPSHERPLDMKDLKGYATVHDMNRSTLYKWLKSPYFKRQFEGWLAYNTSSQTAEVVKAMYDAAISPTGTAADKKLWLDYVAKMRAVPTETEHTLKGEVNFNLSDYIKAKRAIK